MTSDAWKYWYPKKEGTVEPEIPKLAEILTLERASRLLDFGCGAGRHALYFAQMGFQVYGFDKSASAIKQAKEALKRENLHAHLKVWDMTNPLPYEDSFSDAIIATRVMHHTYTEKVNHIAQEINRVLKKGGHLFLQVPAYRRQEPKEKQEGWKFTEPEPRTYVALNGEEKGIPHHYFTRQELSKLFPNYTTIQIHRETEHYHGWCWLTRKHK